MRAVVDAIGLGRRSSKIAIYPFTVTDHDLHPLTGANRYVAHFAASDLPFPVKAFWSMTLYDSRGFFVPNTAHVYLINNRSHVAVQQRRLARHLHPAKRAPQPTAARELAPLPRRPRVPPDHAAVRAREHPRHPQRPQLAAPDGAPVRHRRRDLGRHRLRNLRRDRDVDEQRLAPPGEPGDHLVERQRRADRATRRDATGSPGTRAIPAMSIPPKLGHAPRPPRARASSSMIA